MAEPSLRSNRRRNRPPSLDSLEDRVAPATLVVNSLSDSTPAGDGWVSLREAIAAANNNSTTDLGHTGSGADTIVFDPTRMGGTVDLSSAADSSFGDSALKITSIISILGNGEIITRATASPLRLFLIASGGSLTLQNVVLSKGHSLGRNGGTGSGGGGGGAGIGGGILSLGTLTLNGVTMKENIADGGDGGAGNTGFGGGGGGGVGGSGGNPNGGASTGAFGGDGGGGAGGLGRASGSVSGGPGGSGGYGGGGGGGGRGAGFGIGGSGGAGGVGGGGGGGGFGVAAGPAGAAGLGGGAGGTGATAHGGGGGAGLGAAIFNRGGIVNLTNSTFTANGAYGGAGTGGGGDGSGLGAALFNASGTANIVNCTFAGNSATQGGGIYNYSATVNLKNPFSPTPLALSTPSTTLAQLPATIT
jgi:hypothetical protein